MRECGVTGSVYFVDDNFIGNRKAALDLLPHLVEWQKRTGYVMRLACEATLNIAKRPEILEKMREAFFVTVFCGIETPDPDALKAMHKDHNMMVPILEGIRTINSYGMEVVSGIIMGLDTDKPETGDALLRFVEESQIPLLTINLLQALPKTPLWDRLEKEGRLVNDDDGRDSNVEFLLPYDQVVEFLAQMHGSRLPAGKAVRALSVPVRLHLCAADQGAGDARAEELGQHQARPDHAAEHLLEGRRARRLQKSVLEVRAGTAASRRYRGPDRPGDDRTSSDHVCARRIGRPAERVELFDPAARSLGPCRVKPMKTPAPPSRPLEALRELTSARVGLGRSGASLPTDALLAFTLDHARARDAVHTAFDAQHLVAGLAGLGLQVSEVSSQAQSRRDYLRRPDLGRMLDADSRRALEKQSGSASEIVIVIGDGLSPAAVNVHAVQLVRHLAPRLTEAGISLGHVVVASGARVALGDEIGAVLGARMVVMLIGERPGLSAPDSLGAYLTFAPRIGLTDEKRNCVSNIHGGGLSYDEAAFKIAWLVREGLKRQITGVALKDESGGGSPPQITAKQGP